MVSSHYLKKVLSGEGKKVKNPFTISHYRTATNRLRTEKKKKRKRYNQKSKSNHFPVYKIVPVCDEICNFKQRAPVG